jgi:hypothetical protein
MPANFLIVGTQRSGSQAIYKAINKHPDVYCGGEWIQEIPWHLKLKVAQQALRGEFDEVVARRPQDRERLANGYSPSLQWLGFKMLFRSSARWLVHPRFAPALLLDRMEASMDFIAARQELSVIHIVRRNTLDWLKSKHLARVTGYATHRQYPETLRVKIPIKQAIRAAEAKFWVDARLAKLSLSNPYYRVSYEEFSADNQGATKTCLGFLGCDAEGLFASKEKIAFTERQSQGSASRYIENCAELERALEGAGLLFSEPPNSQQ